MQKSGLFKQKSILLRLIQVKARDDVFDWVDDLSVGRVEDQFLDGLVSKFGNLFIAFPEVVNWELLIIVVEFGEKHAFPQTINESGKLRLGIGLTNETFLQLWDLIQSDDIIVVATLQIEALHAERRKLKLLLEEQPMLDIQLYHILAAIVELQKVIEPADLVGRAVSVLLLD